METTSSNSSEKIVVIGGGISGLAASALLAKNGWDVTLLEKNPTLGGRARTLDLGDFHFDMGPSWYMMPEVFDRFFEIFGKKTSDYYQLARLDPRYQVFFDEELSYILADDIDQNASSFGEIEKGADLKLKEYLKESKKTYEDFTKNLVFEDPWNFKVLLNTENLIALLTLIPKFRLFSSWHSYISRYFKDDRLQKILTFPAVFLGGSPYNTPALFSILNWADFGQGVWYPIGGMGKVVLALERLAIEKGVKIVNSASVKSIEVSNGRVTGVLTSDSHYQAEKVIAATDIPYVQSTLIPKEYRRDIENYWKEKSIGISAVLVYLGLNKRVTNAVHHSLYFSKDWKKNFDQILEKKILPDDPSFYISIRTATDSTIAPPESEEIFVLVPLGARTDYDPSDINSFVDKVISKVEKLLKTNFLENIVVKEVFTPKNFESDYNAYHGTALGLSHTLGQSLWFRERTRDSKIKGLFYAGQYTNPGVGVPMALISAQIVAKEIGEAFNQNDLIFKKGSVTYYYSSLFFTGQIKKDVFAFYAYVRLVDDYIDSASPDLRRFEETCKDTVACWEGKRVDNRIVSSFCEMAKRCGFEWAWVEAFWQAMRSDISKKNYANIEELYEYMYGSAEVIGFMMASILSLPNESYASAAMLGRSMQYLNFIRDVKEDMALGRNYLGYSHEDISDPEKWKIFIRGNLARYEKIQNQAEEGYRYIPKKYLISIKTAADMYLWTAKRIYEDPSVVLQKKIKPSVFRILYQIIKNAVVLK